MRRVIVFIVLFVFTVVACVTSCVHKPQVQVVPANGDYPDAIANIILTKCTNSGCHNQASYQNAAGLLLDTWAHMFQGSVYGAEVVAYNTQYSTLLYYCNSYDTTDIRANDPGHLPAPLTLNEYMTLKNWVAAGAPDRNGNIPFASGPDTRQKIYLTVSGCNLIAVIDAQSRVIMRYIPVGTYPGNQSIHDVAVSGDGKYSYVSFYNGTVLQKIDTRTDTVVATTNLESVEVGGAGAWSIINMSPQDTALMVSGYASSGDAITINTATMQINSKLSVDPYTGGTDKFVYPHGLACNAAFDTFFATLQLGNVINKFTFSPMFSYKYISLDGNTPVTTHSPTTPDPHVLQMSPDHSRYFVTCQNTNEVRVMDAYKDTLIATIPVGTLPQEIAYSPSRNYIYVACMQDNANPNTGALGSVYVIDCASLTVVKKLYGDFFQPHDVAVDEQDGLLFVCNTNNAGVAAHHVLGPCSGNIGWYTVYDLNTMLPDGKRYLAGVFPYSMSSRF